jgi:bacillithiol synthase
MRIQPRPFGGPTIVRAYLTGKAGAFFAHRPSDPKAFRYKLAEVQRRFGPEERARAAAALRPTSRRAAQRLQRFVEEGGAVVTTGQQAGFLTGPIYTIYKALTAVRLATELERELGIVVLPVFWTASEDHDWEEVNHAHLGTRRGVRRVELPSGDLRALPMSERPLEAGVENTLEEIRQLIHKQRHADERINGILDSYGPGGTVAGAFNASLEVLLAPFDLLLTDAADPVLKRSSIPVLRRALEEAARHEALLRERGVELRRAGFGEQVAILEGGTNVFYSGRGERERLYRRGEGFMTVSRSRLFDREELLAELEEDPSRFSPNVLLRPVVESAVFPTLSYVAGPGEIAYYGQLGVLYPEFGIEAPVVYPRFGATLVEGWVERDLERLGMRGAEVERPWHELVEQLARAALPTEITAQLKELGEVVSAGYRELIERASGIDPTLVGALGRLRNESLSRVGGAERKIVRALKRRERDAITRLERVREALYPLGGPQERTLNVLPYLAAEPELLGAIYEAIEIPPGRREDVGGERVLGAG